MDAEMPSGDNQLDEKMRLSRSFQNVHGNSFWDGYSLISNYRGVSDALSREYHKYPALIPPYTFMHNKAPQKVKNIKELYTEKEHLLIWDSNKKEGNPETASYFVIYRFEEGQPENIENPANIVGITSDNQYILPYEGGKRKFKYVITAVDAFHNESKGKSKKIKL